MRHHIAVGMAHTLEVADAVLQGAESERRNIFPEREETAPPRNCSAVGKAPKCDIRMIDRREPGGYTPGPLPTFLS